MEYRADMEGYTPFKVTIDGVELLAVVEYHEGFNDFDGWVKHDAHIQGIEHEKKDIIDICAPHVIETILRLFLEAKEAEFEDMKAEQQIRNWEDRQ